MMSGEWKPLHEAPRDAAVRLFLPGLHFVSDEHGRPIAGSIAHGECVGIWNAELSHWVDRATGVKVYASGWQSL